ncbi:putative disease resistance RPP13-like protein 1 [Juglans microcarpa x Juglans regia]|uniref:putative disease resistance RPP13-like protein 1 n=1 Tax=Juglans microcarpa x Juglans regia TaxID=2249226 RepID=UPI001B7E8E98|nr:putative disease resistance RPP13-like protein 1 [Juglans microcarpa x Juglans regia]
MDRLKCLQTLPKFVVSKHDSASGCIGELGKLKNLQGKLLIKELQNVRSADDALNAGLKDKGYLEKLVLECNIPPEEVLCISESQRSVLENLQPRENLKSLSIKRYSGKGFSDWIGGLTSLSELKLFDCKYCSALPSLGHLTSLVQLLIYSCPELKYMPEEGFPASLRFLWIASVCPVLEEELKDNWASRYVYDDSMFETMEEDEY